MKRNKIAIRLGLNFAVALLVFSIIIGSAFIYLFKNYSLDGHKKEMLHYAETLAKALSDNNSSSGSGRGPSMMGNGMKGRGMMGSTMGNAAYINFIVDALDADVWIVDKDLNMVTTERGHHMVSGKYNISDLPANAEELVQKILRGQSAFSEGFSETLEKRMLTVGVPIEDKSSEVIGAVLMHSPVEGIDAAIGQGLSIMGMSILLALVMTSALSWVLSYSFTRPLYKMKDVALKLSQGDYTAQCNITQDDEIGELSTAIDLLAARLDEASQESEKLEQLRRDFVANISHELRTPITVIRGSLEALIDQVVTEPEKIQEYNLQMLGETKFLERLVRDLLDLSRLQNMDFSMDMSRINICDVLSDVSRSASQLAREKNVNIQIKNPENCFEIHGDYGRIRQMLLIILDNAIKFSPQGADVEINITEGEISIRDFGPGIDKSQLEHIFDRFYKTYGEENKDGTGLGLAIARQIADRHKIGLKAENGLDKGAIFTLTFPLNKKDEKSKMPPN